MLRTKLFKCFALLVILFGALSAYVGIRTIKHRVIAEAQTRVSMDLSSAWSLLNNKLHELEVILRLAASKEAVVTMCEQKAWSDAEVAGRLERIRLAFGLDFLDLIAPDGKVMLRTTAPHATGDSKLSDPAVAAALHGGQMVAMSLMPQRELEQESDGLADRSLIELEDTPRARLSNRKAESRGMVMVGAIPVWQGAQVLGVVYGGVLMNRNHDLVDRICALAAEYRVVAPAPLGR